jgi:hypothetical protein
MKGCAFSSSWKPCETTRVRLELRVAAVTDSRSVSYRHVQERIASQRAHTSTRHLPGIGTGERKGNTSSFGCKVRARCVVFIAGSVSGPCPDFPAASFD